MLRTSKTHPLEIAAVRVGPSHGRIGITFCPGKHDNAAMTGVWARDLSADLDVIASWGARLVLTLVEQHELEALQVPHLGSSVRSRGIFSPVLSHRARQEHWFAMRSSASAR